MVAARVRGPNAPSIVPDEDRERISRNWSTETSQPTMPRRRVRVP
jgi:hypothetical protein